MIAVFSCDEGPRERGPFFMYTKPKKLYKLNRVCIANPHFLYRIYYLRKKKIIFFNKNVLVINIYHIFADETTNN